jgi:hypothetical protein
VITVGASKSCISLLIETSLVLVVSSPALDRGACLPCDLRRLKHAKAIKAAAIPTMRPPTDPPMAAPNVVGWTDAIAALLAAAAAAWLVVEAIDDEASCASVEEDDLPFADPSLEDAPEDTALEDALLGDVMVEDAMLEDILLEDTLFKEDEDESLI